MPETGMDAPYQFSSAASASEFGLQVPPPILDFNFPLFLFAPCVQRVERIVALVARPEHLHEQHLALWGVLLRCAGEQPHDVDHHPYDVPRGEQHRYKQRQ